MKTPLNIINLEKFQDMAQIITARLSRNEGQAWGFRLQGGKDFGTPLTIQKVNGGSVADQAGLQAGDAVVRVNGTDLYNLRHKDAQDVIVRAGPSFELVVQRGGATWKPSVTPIGQLQTSNAANNIQPVTKTSLMAKPQQPCTIGSGHNSAAKPFNQAQNPMKSIVNKQYNTPVGMYSEQTIAETLSAQAEVLSNGVLGVNFKKNEKIYNPENSEVLKMLQESDTDPEPVETFAPTLEPKSNYAPAPAYAPQTVTRSVQAPIDRPISNTNGGLPAGQNICADCERLIVGVFVRIKDKNLHVECFKCATCGTSLKNQGYYNLHNKLYCDVHARLVALNSPPPSAASNGLVPVTIPPKNLGASAISSALNMHANNMNGNLSNTATISIETHASLPMVEINTNIDTADCNDRSTMDTNGRILTNNEKLIQETESTMQKSTNGRNDQFQYKTINGGIIRSVIPPGKGLNVTYTVNSGISGPKPFSYTQPQSYQGTTNFANPPMAGPKSPASYPPPAQPAWAPPSAMPSAMAKPTSYEPQSNVQDTKMSTNSIPINMLKESVERLNISSNDSDFRRNASNVLAAMLEARMKKTNGQQRPIESSTGEIRINEKSEPFITQSNHSTLPLLDSQKESLPIPPPPPLPKITTKREIVLQTLNTDTIDNSPNKENIIYQHNDVQITPTKNLNDDITGKVKLRNKLRNTHQQKSIKEGQQDGIECAISITNKPEVSTHARDRRSYIEHNNATHDKVDIKEDFEPLLESTAATKLVNELALGQLPVCDKCQCKITRGPFITALGRIWCPEHFVCVNSNCKRQLADIGFVEEKGDLYCEYCFEQFLAPPCSKCNIKIKGDCLNAIGKKFHPECFKCSYCGKLFGNCPFFLEEGEAYCEADWNELFTTKCFSCGFPVEAGDRWVEALNNNYHSQCFNCTYCKTNLEGKSFFAKGGRPFCKNHAR